MQRHVFAQLLYIVILISFNIFDVQRICCALFFLYSRSVFVYFVTSTSVFVLLSPSFFGDEEGMIYSYGLHCRIMSNMRINLLR
jgi:hypothetical protein